MINDEEFIIEAGRRPNKKRRNVLAAVAIVLSFVLSFVLVSVVYPPPHYEKVSERKYEILNLITAQSEYYIYTKMGIFILNKTRDNIDLQPGSKMALAITAWNWCTYERCWPSHATYKIYV
jgi:hypothetical protein